MRLACPDPRQKCALSRRCPAAQVLSVQSESGYMWGVREALLFKTSFWGASVCPSFLSKILFLSLMLGCGACVQVRHAAEDQVSAAKYEAQRAIRDLQSAASRLQVLVPFYRFTPLRKPPVLSQHTQKCFCPWLTLPSFGLKSSARAHRWGVRHADGLCCRGTWARRCGGRTG